MSAISICLATCKRLPQLEALLGDLGRQTLAPLEVVVVDNDAQGSARAVVQAAAAAGLPVRYEIQPLKNIALTRNRTVALARGEWLAFIDDDERAPPRWLEQLDAAAARFAAGAVLGPVLPELPEQAPRWIQKGRFYDWARMGTGTVVPLNQLRFGNVLIRASLLRNHGIRFDPAYGLTGGEDGDLLARLAPHTRIVWCDEAVVREPVAPARLTLAWLLRRSLRGGQDFARHAVNGRYGRFTALRRSLLLARSALQLLLACGLALTTLPLGRHVAARWLTKASANLGKLSTFWGWHYREYA